MGAFLRQIQGVVTPIGIILMATTGDMVRSLGHGGFFHRITKVFQGGLNGHKVNIMHTLSETFCALHAIWKVELH